MEIYLKIDSDIYFEIDSDITNYLNIKPKNDENITADTTMYTADNTNITADNL
jgi:hypothetical protein